MMEKNSKIFVAGHRGLVGSAICRRLEKDAFARILKRTSAELDLRNQQAVEDFFAVEKPEYVFLAAARVGGIHANDTYPADFIRDNLQIQTNVIDAAYRHGARKLLFLGSSCIYPKLCPQPIKEEYLQTGPLEATNRPYAVAKIAGIEMCWAFNRQYGTRYLAVMPTNLYGPGDNYDLQTSHVLPALIRKAHEAKVRGDRSFKVWGTGTPRREFLYSDDLADACVFLMTEPGKTAALFCDHEPPLVNIGCGQDVTIAELAGMVAEAVGFEGEIEFDASKPDGTPQKLLDVSRMRDMGWRSNVALPVGIGLAYKDFQEIWGESGARGLRCEGGTS